MVAVCLAQTGSGAAKEVGGGGRGGESGGVGNDYDACAIGIVGHFANYVGVNAAGDAGIPIFDAIDAAHKRRLIAARCSCDGGDVINVNPTARCLHSHLRQTTIEKKESNGDGGAENLEPAGNFDGARE